MNPGQLGFARRKSSIRAIRTEVPVGNVTRGYFYRAETQAYRYRVQYRTGEAGLSKQWGSESEYA